MCGIPTGKMDCFMGHPFGLGMEVPIGFMGSTLVNHPLPAILRDCAIQSIDIWLRGQIWGVRPQWQLVSEVYRVVSVTHTHRASQFPKSKFLQN